MSLTAQIDEHDGVTDDGLLMAVRRLREQPAGTGMADFGCRRTPGRCCTDVLGLAVVACQACGALALIEAPLLLVRPGDYLPLLVAVARSELGDPSPSSGPQLLREAQAAGLRGEGLIGPMVPLPRPWSRWYSRGMLRQMLPILNEPARRSGVRASCYRTGIGPFSITSRLVNRNGGWLTP